MCSIGSPSLDTMPHASWFSRSNLTAMLWRTARSLHQAFTPRRDASKSGVSAVLAHFKLGTKPSDSQLDSLRSELSGSLHGIPRPSLSSLLVSMAYFGSASPANYEDILSHMNRTDVSSSDNTVLPSLKTYELMLRCGLVPGFSFDMISSYNKKYLLKARATPWEVPHQPTPFESEVSSLLTSVSRVHHSGVVLGPYRLEFAQLGETGVAYPDVSNVDKSDLIGIIKRCVCVEPVDQNVIVGPSNALSPERQIRQAVIKALGINAVTIPVWDWSTLHDDRSKVLYLTSLIGEAQIRPKAPR